MIQWLFLTRLIHFLTMRHSLVLVLVGALVALSFGYKRPPTKPEDVKPLEWWQRTVIYQIYPRSFMDSDGDGIGDIKGIISKLDHFVDLGIESIWISPIYKSPMVDFGYDISDFTDIEPQFGTLDDFKTMVVEFRKRGLKIIMDMVPNHSSDQHEWFNKSINRVEPYTDFYVWKDPKGFDDNGKPIPPNNWVSVFSGSMWEWNDQRQQFYLHQFTKEQPDLNFENRNVRLANLAVIKFWLDLGVDGFRIDAVPFLLEDPEFRDAEPDAYRDPAALPDEYRYWNHKYNENLPGVIGIMAEVRQLLDIYTADDGIERCMMTEAYIPDSSVPDYYGTPDKPVAHFPFNFHMLNVRPNLNATEVAQLIDSWYDVMPEGRWANTVFGNHDQRRLIDRWTAAGIDSANMINLMLQGTAVTYYGEEIGMENAFLSWEDTVDPQACNTDPERYADFSRDPERTPLQWDNTKNAGFSTANKTWLPVHPNYVTVNIAAQNATDDSHLSVYKNLMKLRATNAWKYGGYESQVLNNETVLGISRIAHPEVDSTGILVLVNLSNSTATVTTTAFEGVPESGTVAVKSVGFDNPNVVVGGQINTRSIPLGPRNSIVITFNVQ